MRYLSENKHLEVRQVILVAPWVNPENNAVSDTADFFDFAIDPDFPSRAKSIDVFVSSDDEPNVVTTVNRLKDQTKGVVIHQFTSKGHFTLKSLGMPELLELITRD